MGSIDVSSTGFMKNGERIDVSLNGFMASLLHPRVELVEIFCLWLKWLKLFRMCPAAIHLVLIQGE